MLRAIDVGYGHTKLTTGPIEKRDSDRHVPITSFHSAPFPRQPSMEMGGMEKGPSLVNVKVGGIEYSVSDNPASVAPEISSRVRGGDYVGSNTYEVCLAAAVKLLETDHLDVLVLGTPVSNFATARETLKNKFGRGIQFDGASVEIKELKVVIQPIGGLVWHYLSSGRAAEVGRHRRLLVDVGYGTLDWVVAEGLTVNAGKSGSAQFGVSKFLDVVHAQLNPQSKTIGQNLAFYDDLDRMVMHGDTIMYRGKPCQREMYGDLLGRLANEATQQIAATVGDPVSLSSVVLMGGGARLLQSALSRAYKDIKVELIESAQFANVRGFQAIAEHVRK
jgi:plasmid segregation protein ParM